MQFKLNELKKDIQLFIGSQGVTNKHGLGYLVKQNIVTDEPVEIKPNTLIEIRMFNYNTDKVRIKCIKDIKTFEAEVDSLYLLEKCSFSSKELMKPIECMTAKHYVRNVIDSDSVIHITMSIIIFLIGFILGRML